MPDPRRDLVALGWDAARAEEVDGRVGVPGRVVRQDRGWVQVATADGVDRAKTRADRVGTPVVGDWVLVVDREVAEVLERRSALRRADPLGEGEQVLAANVDRVLIVSGLDRPVKAGRIHRAAAQAWDAGAEPVVVLTKTDLADDPVAARDRVAAEHPGLEVVAVSAHRGDGVDELHELLSGGTVVLLGESGAGKSSLLNALAADDLAAIGEVREGDSKGRHTTTRRELHLLPGGGIVVDTPGVRSLGLFAGAGAVDAAFPDIEERAVDCRFNNCSHDQEPGCAVRAAVEAGDIAAARLDAYLGLQAEAAAATTEDFSRRRGRRRRR